MADESNGLSQVLSALQPWAGPIGGLAGSMVTALGIAVKSWTDSRRETRRDSQQFTQSERDALIRDASEFREELRRDLKAAQDKVDATLSRLDDCEKARDQSYLRYVYQSWQVQVALQRIGDLEQALTKAGISFPPTAYPPPPFNPDSIGGQPQSGSA